MHFFNGFDMTVDPSNLCQVELKVFDLNQALSFYEHVFGWSVSPAAIHNYIVLQVPRNCPFGISLIPQESAPMERFINNGLVLYFRIRNIDETIERLETYGGRLKIKPTILPSYGRFCQIIDNQGYTWGLIED